MKSINEITKKAMVDFIEETHIVINFDRNYLMRKTKENLYPLYVHCYNIRVNGTMF